MPTAPGHYLELIADLFNALNFVDGDWGVRRGIDTSRLLTLVGYDQVNQRGVYEVNTIHPETRDDASTRWYVQLGARYWF